MKDNEEIHAADEIESDIGFDESGLSHVLENLAVEDAENGAEFDPDTAEQFQSEAEKEKRDEAEAEAEAKRHAHAVETVVQALGMYETGIQLGAHKRFVLPDEEKAAAAEYLAPAVMKYLPDGFDIHGALFGKYKAEVMGAIGLYMLSKSTISSVKELRLQDKEAEAEKQRQRKSANDASPEKNAA